MLSERQDQTAVQLVRDLHSLAPGRKALLNLTGAAGSGKTSVLRRVADQMHREKVWLPLLVTAPNKEGDSGPIALLETADQLRAGGLLNGEVAILSDPTRPWAEKMAAITNAVDRNSSDVVILCDEPALWYRLEESLLAGTPHFSARAFADWIESRALCRRIITGWIPGDSRPAARVRAPRLDDGREMLLHPGDWGTLADCVSQLRGSLPEPLPDRTAWQMKLCVALATVLPPGEVASVSMSEASAKVILEQVFDLVETRVEYRDLCTTLAKLALARTHLEKAVLNEFMADLPEPERALIETCLLDWTSDRAGLHPLVRDEVLKRDSLAGREEKKKPWRLPRSRRMAVHDQLAIEYEIESDTDLRDPLERLHHEMLGESFHHLDSDARLKFVEELLKSHGRLKFVEQLDEIGRTLSYKNFDHRSAVNVFRLAVQLVPEHAYAHHYLAYNLDWLAEETEDLEFHYREAIRLQPTHPWYWSRWISYLATRGRFREAKTTWREALDELSISEDGSPDWMFLSLHRWVARWLLHWAELDFAEKVLRAIPRDLTEEDSSVQALWSLLRALRKAERGDSVFPLSVPPSEWRSPTPHTDLPTRFHDAPLHSWVPARVEAIDQEDGVAFLLAAKLPASQKDEFSYFETDLRLDQVEAAACNFEWDNLREGSFIELAYYGEDKEPKRIAMHRETTWHDPNLLPLYPRPERWYERAVQESWKKEAEAD
jgi:tetratricopeptide (TPR) repeat protein